MHSGLSGRVQSGGAQGRGAPTPSPTPSRWSSRSSRLLLESPVGASPLEDFIQLTLSRRIGILINSPYVVAKRPQLEHHIEVICARGDSAKDWESLDGYYFFGRDASAFWKTGAAAHLPIWLDRGELTVTLVLKLVLGDERSPAAQDLLRQYEFRQRMPRGSDGNIIIHHGVGSGTVAVTLCTFFILEDLGERLDFSVVAARQRGQKLSEGSIALLARDTLAGISQLEQAGFRHLAIGPTTAYLTIDPATGDAVRKIGGLEDVAPIGTCSVARSLSWASAPEVVAAAVVDKFRSGLGENKEAWMSFTQVVAASNGGIADSAARFGLGATVLMATTGEWPFPRIAMDLPASARVSQAALLLAALQKLPPETGVKWIDDLLALFLKLHSGASPRPSCSTLFTALESTKDFEDVLCSQVSFVSLDDESPLFDPDVSRLVVSSSSAMPHYSGDSGDLSQVEQEELFELSELFALEIALEAERDLLENGIERLKWIETASQWKKLVATYSAGGDLDGILNSVAGYEVRYWVTGTRGARVKVSVVRWRCARCPTEEDFSKDDMREHCKSACETRGAAFLLLFLKSCVKLEDIKLGWAAAMVA